MSTAIASPHSNISWVIFAGPPLDILQLLQLQLGFDGHAADLCLKYKKKLRQDSLSLKKASLGAVLDSLGYHLPVQEGCQVL